MTTEPTEPHVDGDATAPSAEPEAPETTSPATRRSFPRPLLIAVAAAVVAIGAGVFALTPSDDGDQKVAADLTSATATTEPATTAPPGGEPDDPSSIWGRTWDVVSLTDDGDDRPVVAPVGGLPLRLDAFTRGLAIFNGCNGAGAWFNMWMYEYEGEPRDDSQLTYHGPVTFTRKVCEPPALMDQEAWLQSFLEGKPTVTIVDDHLTLATDTATIELNAVSEAMPTVRPEDIAGPWIDPDAPLGDLSALWDKTWTLVQVTEGNETTSWRSPPGPQSEAVAIIATAPHFLRVSCFTPVRAYTLAGSALSSAEIPEATVDRTSCQETERQTQLREFLDGGATVELQGEHLSLTAGGLRFDLELAVVGNFWSVDSELVQAVRGGVDTPVVPAGLVDDGRPPQFSAGFRYGLIEILTCGAFFQSVELTGGKLTPTKGWTSSSDSCDAAPEAAIEQDAWLRGLMDAGPTVTIDGDRITFEQGDDRAVFQAR